MNLVVVVLPTVEESRRLLLRKLLGAISVSIGLGRKVNFVQRDGRPVRQSSPYPRISVSNKIQFRWLSSSPYHNTDSTVGLAWLRQDQKLLNRKN